MEVWKGLILTGEGSAGEEGDAKSRGRMDLVPNQGRSSSSVPRVALLGNWDPSGLQTLA